MVRWRCLFLLAMLLVLPARIGSKSDDEGTEDDENTEEESDDNDSDDDDDSEEPAAEKPDMDPGRRVPALIPTPKTIAITRTTAKRPLECYVCAYKVDTPIKSCLDPTKYRVHTMTCHSLEDKCFTTVISKSSSLEAVVRGCRSGCVSSSETTCCELNRCNNQAFAMPVISPRALAASKTTKTIPTTVLFFVTILLVLQTVVKVAFV
ncbi:uncharacterized protein [Epargyreus clarus]|uniref:uncharacterized protein isoform X2 n=1 Tax=Epargyreus clarus TaxID=520877 RepID=UPI003C2E9452